MLSAGNDRAARLKNGLAFGCIKLFCKHPILKTPDGFLSISPALLF
jgi:hypothetical protein